MPYVRNPKFLPVNRSAAKDQIFRTITHDHEIENFGMISQKEQSVKALMVGSPENRTPNNFEKAL